MFKLYVEVWLETINSHTNTTHHISPKESTEATEPTAVGGRSVSNRPFLYQLSLKHLLRFISWVSHQAIISPRPPATRPRHRRPTAPQWSHPRHCATVVYRGQRAATRYRQAAAGAGSQLIAAVANVLQIDWKGAR